MPRPADRPWLSLLCEICGKTFKRRKRRDGKPPQGRVLCSGKCRGILGYLSVPRQETRIEKSLEKMLQKLHVRYVKQEQLEGLTVPDFYVPAKKTVVYADGDYWHSTKRARKRDGFINWKLEKLGYKVLRFAEHQINDSPALVMDRLRFELLA